MKTDRIRVYGIVQGVGFRPFVSRTCKNLGINGTVANKGSYVEIFAQGENVNELINALNHCPPARAVILNILQKQIDTKEFSSFEIIESERDDGEIFVSPDIAICKECKKELYDKKNRRYMHPFINCTNCGPRLTILDSMPYDRVRTSMKEFPMCPECEYEYTHPETRRYDAQPVCCPNCGPIVYAFDPKTTSIDAIKESINKTKTECNNILNSNNIDNSNNIVASNSIDNSNIVDNSNTSTDQNILIGRSAITAARKAIISGQIVAIKGIGGFHLCCDAKNEEAVNRLRLLKNRPMKPFAVMMRDIDTVQRECFIPMQIKETGTPAVSAADKETNDNTSDNAINDNTTESDNLIYELLTGHQKPIVLLEKRADSSLADSVAPDNPKLGVMLPYTPIHLLLFDYDDEYTVPDCLIMTSANASGAPICRTDEDAISEISSFTDLVLSNNRMIRTRADDTVTDIYDGKPYMIRRSRGFAPLPIMITDEQISLNGTALGIGGELKNTFCIAKNNLLYPSAYVGDMEDIRTVNALEESVERMEELLEAKPSVIVSDLHPKYNTTAVAEELADKYDIPLIKIQHHYAHILSCMAENDHPGDVIGVSFDGTGYGTDGTIWGGEYLLSRLDGFERLGHITPFIQCGGDASSKEGWRIAASILGDFTDKLQTFDKETITNKLGLCTGMEYDLLQNMAKMGINSITSTSAGRLFDAVSAILGIRRSSTFEGEAATALMFSAEKYAKEKGILSLNSSHDLTGMTKSFTDTNDLVRYIANEKLLGQEAGKLAFIFHMKLAEIIADNVIHLSKETGIKTAALSGGVFQNTLLLNLTVAQLEQTDIRILHHSIIPPNDGGICVGQALAGLYALNK